MSVHSPLLSTPSACFAGSCHSRILSDTRGMHDREQRIPLPAAGCTCGHHGCARAPVRGSAPKFVLQPICFLWSHPADIKEKGLPNREQLVTSWQKDVGHRSAGVLDARRFIQDGSHLRTTTGLSRLSFVSTRVRGRSPRLRPAAALRSTLSSRIRSKPVFRIARHDLLDLSMRNCCDFVSWCRSSHISQHMHP